jgi:hypothetical protein
MEKAVQDVFSTLISNFAVMFFVVVYLYFRQSSSTTGTQYLSSSTSKSLLTVLSVTDSEILSFGGPDTHLYLTLTRYLSYILFLFAFIGLVCLLPMYNAQSNPLLPSISRFSIESMKADDKTLLIPAVCFFLFSFCVYLAVYLYYRLGNSTLSSFDSVFSI